MVYIYNTMVQTFESVIRINPQVLLTIENPTAMFRLHPSIRSLVHGKPSEWRLLEVDYCSVADPRYDGDSVYTNKPTDVVAFGVRGADVFNLPKCNLDCRYRFPDYTSKSKYHLRSIRLDWKSPPGQEKQYGSLRHAVPCGLFHALFQEHERWLCARIPSASSIVVSTTGTHLDTIVAPVETRASKAARASESSTIHKPRRKPLVEESHVQADGHAPLTRGQRLYLLLHYRFGHASLKRLRAMGVYHSILKKKHRVECPVCMAAKAAKKPHVGKLLRMAYVLGLVHFDIQGPFAFPDIDKNLYVLVLVDDHSNKKWLYRLRTKDQLGPSLRLWMALLGVCPERLRHDGAGENLGNNGLNSVVQICYERGIYAERTVPYNPQQLTRVERVNRTFLEMARCMLITTPGVSLDLWGYAYMHACFLDEFLSNDALDKCPYAIWHGEEPSLDMLNSFRTWGSIVYFTHNDDRHKLQMPGHRGRFLGYCPVSDGCYIRDLDHAQAPVRVTRDVLQRSYCESQHLVREPVGVEMQEFKLLAHEPPTEILGDCGDAPWESILLQNCLPVDNNTLEYYRDYQSYAKDRRMLMAKNASKPPAAVEAAIKREWRELQVKAAEKKRAARDVAQRHGYDVDAERVPTRMAEQPRSVPEAARDSGTASAAAPPSDSSPTARDKRAAARASRDGDGVAPAPAKRPKLHDVDGAATESAYRPGRFASAPIDDIPCAECGDHRPHPNNAIICCDACNKAFHQECFKISVLPDADADWLCHNCLEPGMRVSVYFCRDKQWHDGVVRAQRPHGQGTEVVYDNGSRALENMYALRWKPLYDMDLAHIIALVSEPESDNIQNLGVWLSTTPRSLAHLKKFPEVLQRKWHASRLKEFRSIIGKGAAEIVDKSVLPPNAIVICVCINVTSVGTTLTAG
jgi:hypothetical protein